MICTVTPEYPELDSIRQLQQTGMDKSELRGVKNMYTIRYAVKEDKEFWYTLDRHLPQTEFERKVQDRMGYLILEDDRPVGLLRYNLFWDNTPFCTMLFVDSPYQSKGYGRKLMEFWEEEMKKDGYGIIMTSTQVDENAQHFYRKLGYKDCGCLIIDIPEYEQPMEMFLIKAIENR